VLALEEFINEAAARHEEVRTGSVGSVRSEGKGSAIEMIRQALGKAPE
jgi:hypothetical protein